MAPPASNLHVRLSERSITALKARASQRGSAAWHYVTMILRYRAVVGTEARSVDPFGVQMSEKLYFVTPLPATLRARLTIWSKHCQSNLSAFAGSLIEDFIERHERDPGDFEMLCQLGELLERNQAITDDDLEAMIRRAANGAVSRMPLAYQVRWYHSRLQPPLGAPEYGAATRELTTEQVASILARVRG
jgi:hypothetical protein